MLFPPSALERAMQIKEVLLRAMNKEYSWLQAAEILGITPRGLRRLRERMEQFGYQGLVDRRRGRPSPRLTPVAELERILELYRVRYPGFNARHFCSTVRRQHGVTLLYTCVKQILLGSGVDQETQGAGPAPNAAGEEALQRVNRKKAHPGLTTTWRERAAARTPSAGASW